LALAVLVLLQTQDHLPVLLDRIQFLIPQLLAHLQVVLLLLVVAAADVLAAVAPEYRARVVLVVVAEKPRILAVQVL